MTVYRIEFHPDWSVPPITIDFSDRPAADQAVTNHALPYLKTTLTKKGRPELADCFFHLNRDMAYGQFVHMNLGEGKGARFCPAKLTPTDLDPDLCGDTWDDDVCALEPGHDGDHQNDYATASWHNAFSPNR